MSEASIHRRISNLRQKKKELNSRKKRYEKMKEQINVIITELQGAKKYVDDAYGKFLDNYISAEASKKAENIDWERERIEIQISKAKNYVYEANLKIKEIRKKIEDIEDEIDDLKEELANLEE